jgi:hypothetical protein
MTSPEPPTVIETVVKAAIKGATAIPVVGSGLSAAAQVVYDDVCARRAAVAARTMSEIVTESGGEEQLGARLAADPQLETSFVAAVDAAIRTGHEQKRRLLVQAVASAVKDDAKVDEAQLLIETLAQLDVPHIRALAELARLRKRSTGPHYEEGVYLANLPAPIRATLVRVEAARLNPEVGLDGAGGEIESETTISFEDDDGITKYGQEILEALHAMSDER